MWLYHNGHINPMVKLLKIKGLSEEHKLKEKDWNSFSVEDAEIMLKRDLNVSIRGD